MEWWLIVSLFIGGLLFLMGIGVPVAFCFLLVNLIGIYIFWGPAGLEQLVIGMSGSVATSSYLPLVTFVLMGAIMSHTGMVTQIVDALDKWLGRIPGRLTLLTVLSGTILSTVSGSSMASASTLTKALIPEMHSRGYHKFMFLGSVLGSGGLAVMIPPSTLGVILASLAGISIGKFLIAIIIPGFLMAFFYLTYILTICKIKPSLAPPYDVPNIPLREKITALVVHILPLGGIVFLVVGVIFLGLATPTEAASLGALGTIVLAFLYRKLSWELLKKSLMDTVEIAGMSLIIITGAFSFSQLLAYSGATAILIESLASLNAPPVFVLILMLFSVLILGMFVSAVPNMMIVIPIFMPVIHAVGLDPLWVGVLVLIVIEMSQTTPPVGILMYVVKSALPKDYDVTSGDIMKATLPYLLCDLAALIVIIIFPAFALWLPNLMR
ncbi:MAG: TRAP transporter large permease [Desulfitobacteriia bacterium]|jgi:tripartite ATP-independent transporter DctM subunit